MNKGLTEAQRRVLHDVSSEAMERSRREREHAASWGTPERCKTNIVHPVSADCLRCGAINGEDCRSPAGRAAIGDAHG